MSGEISVWNPRSAWNRLVGGASVAVFILLAGTGLFGIYKAHEAYQHFCRTRQVRTAIKHEDYALAKMLLDVHEKKGTLPPEELVYFKHELSQEEGAAAKILETTRVREQRKKEESETRGKLQNIEGLLSSGDIKKARTLFNEFKKSGERSNKDTAVLEERLQGFAEQKLFGQLSPLGKEKSIDICNLYLKLYPDGMNKVQIAETLLINQFLVLSDYFSSNEDFGETYSYLQTLNRNLEKFAADGITLSNLVSVKDFMKQADAYLASALGKNTSSIVVGAKVKKSIVINYSSLVGKTVKVLGAQPSSTLGTMYTGKRDAIFPPGSTGQIIHADNTLVSVKFSNYSEFISRNELNYPWFISVEGAREFEIREWKRVKKIWQYELNELELSEAPGATRVISVDSYTSSVCKNLFMRELDKLKQNVERYK